MIIAAKILFWCFGVIGAIYMLELLFGKMNWHKMFLLIISIVIVAASAGYVYGGLLQQIK